MNWGIATTRIMRIGLRYLLRDEFLFARAAGSVNGTAAEPTGGARVVIDTNSKISITAGVLDFATGAAINDGAWWGAQARQAGRVLLARVTPSDTNGIAVIGWDTNQAGAINDALKFAAGGVIQIVPNGGTALNVGVYTAATYFVASTMRSAGLYWHIMGGAFAHYTMLHATTVGNAAGYPATQAGSSTSVFRVG